MKHYAPMEISFYFHSQYFKHVLNFRGEGSVFGFVHVHEDSFYVAVATRPCIGKRDVVHLTLLGQKLNDSLRNTLGGLQITLHISAGESVKKVQEGVSFVIFTRPSGAVFRSPCLFSHPMKDLKTIGK